MLKPRSGSFDGGGQTGRAPARDLALALIAMTLAAMFAWHGARYPRSFNSRPPFAVRTTHGGLPSPPPVADADGPTRPRLVLVVIDGLRDDKAGALGLEGAPSRTGTPPPLARCTLETYWPSYTFPGCATIGTGAPPMLSGVHNNRFAGRVELDSVFARARAAGLSVGAVTDRNDLWDHMFPSELGRQAMNAGAFARATGNLFADGAPSWDFTLLHTALVDDAGHESGAASEPYARAVEETGAWLRKAVARLDAARDTLVITSDHGHIDRGGHGGTEPEAVRVPFFLIGRGARTGVSRDACSGRRTTDVAPTVATLLGVDPPHQATGSLLRPLLALEPSALDAADAAGRRERAALAAALGRDDGDAAAAVGTPRGPGLWTGALGIGVAAAFAWLLFLVAGPVANRPAGNRLVALSAAAAYPAAGWLTLLFIEPGLSLSARQNLGGAYALRLFLLLSGAALVGLGIDVIVFAGAMPDVVRRARAMALAGSAASWPIVVGLHGSRFGAPLGEPHLAAGVLLAGAIGCVGCGSMGVLLLLDAVLAWSAIRHPSSRPADKMVPARFRSGTDRST